MKADKLLEELTTLAKSLDYNVRREQGAFRGGACLMKEQRLIIINRSMPIEAACVILARAMCQLVPEDVFLKPAVREIIDRERAWAAAHPEVTFEPTSKEAA
ncbi:MAG: hypothetical protein FJ211_02345 [Ignavibacteria bacterium]|nr:hypothetical protein [Ignavibacteria bacterium]